MESSSYVCSPDRQEGFMRNRRTAAATLLATAAAVAAAGALLAPAPVAEAQPPPPIVATTKLTVPGLEDHSRFGTSVAISGDFAVVGAPFDDALIGVPLDDTTGATGLSGSGSVTGFYRPEDWGFRSSLTAGASAGNFELFGTAVEMSALTAVVGAPEDDQSGSVYVFVRPDDAVSPWTLQARLGSGFSPGNDFGASVAVFGDVLFVGEPSVSTFFGEGIVYVFQRVGTVWQQRLRDFGPTGALAFGRSVAIGGFTGSETAIVGPPDTNQRTGVAFVYRRSGSSFSRQNSITAADASTTDKFGYDVDLTPGTALIGAPEDNVTGTDNGSAYVVSVP
jgi:hypothetical protein